MSWVAVDGYSSYYLGTAAQDGYQNLAYTWNNAFLGFIPGSIGETSTLAILVGLAILLYTKVASWRIVLGVAIGTILQVIYSISLERNQSHVFYAFLVAHGNWWICFWLSLHGY